VRIAFPLALPLMPASVYTGGNSHAKHARWQTFASFNGKFSRLIFG